MWSGSDNIKLVEEEWIIQSKKNIQVVILQDDFPHNLVAPTNTANKLTESFKLILCFMRYTIYK